MFEELAVFEVGVFTTVKVLDQSLDRIRFILREVNAPTEQLLPHDQLHKCKTPWDLDTDFAVVGASGFEERRLGAEDKTVDFEFGLSTLDSQVSEGPVLVRAIPTSVLRFDGDAGDSLLP